MKLSDGTDSTGSTSCCQKGSDLYHVGPQLNILALRQIGRACSKLDMTTTCVDAECDYGPCGARKVQVAPSDVGTAVRIFEPASNPQGCGTHQIVNGQPVDSPEQFSDQPTYPGVTARCPYMKCLSGGLPAVKLTVTAETHNATGNVTSTPLGISISGAGTSTKVFPKDLDSPSQLPRVTTLIAEPKGRHARAKFSGSCTHTGDFGKKVYCHVPLTPDPQVTVAYECHEGRTCENSELGSPSN